MKNTRQCVVITREKNEIREQVAVFHRWHERFFVIEPSLMVGGGSGGQGSLMFAIVEYENGQIDMVIADSIRFTDVDRKPLL